MAWAREARPGPMCHRHTAGPAGGLPRPMASPMAGRWALAPIRVQGRLCGGTTCLLNATAEPARGDLLVAWPGPMGHQQATGLPGGLPHSMAVPMAQRGDPGTTSRHTYYNICPCIRLHNDIIY